MAASNRSVPHRAVVPGGMAYAARCAAVAHEERELREKAIYARGYYDGGDHGQPEAETPNDDA